MTENDVEIPVSRKFGIYYKGKSCGNHFFVSDYQKILDILKDNSFASNIKVGYYLEHYKEAAEAFKNDSCASLLISLMDIKSGNDKILLIGYYRNYPKNISDDIRVMPYNDCASGKITRELLAQIIFHEKKYIIFEDKEYKVCNIQDKNFSNNARLDCIVQKLPIVKSYKSFKGKDTVEDADVLIYSPKTKRYEIAHAKYDESNSEYFTDSTSYKLFCERYGKPPVDIIPKRKNGDRVGYSDYNVESMLYVFGYNASQKDNLSDVERHEILSYIIDLNLMKRERIMDFISWLISMRATRWAFENAIDKWENDLAFLYDYK
ncbi:MAG: hypothetical protein LUD03_04080, partial [Firmicutes bacterium]|nr:hypothetical protein [Bacillota bacterium]